jgi:tetratricopeptide (TPR) repeat protein
VAPTPEPEPKPAPEPAAIPTVPAAELDEMRERLEEKDSDHETRLRLANALRHIDIEEALEHYTRLISSSAKTTEVISNLEDYIEKRPQTAPLLRTLGDAYMKEGMLDKALKTYNQAMELL